MKSEIPPAIVDPCPLEWDGMQGNAKRRFCEHCQLHVHNLSQMAARERQALLSSGGHLCVTYAVDERGALIEQARRHWLHTFFSGARGALLALAAVFLPLGTSCAGRQIMGKPMPPAPSPTPEQPSSDRQIFRGEAAPATPTPPPKLVVPGGIEIPPPTPTPTPAPPR